MLAKISVRLFWNSNSKRLIICQDITSDKNKKRLNLETCCLKSMKYLVTLLYYIIQKPAKNYMILRRWYWTEKKCDFYISLRELKTNSSYFVTENIYSGNTEFSIEESCGKACSSVEGWSIYPKSKHYIGTKNQAWHLICI